MEGQSASRGAARQLSSQVIYRSDYQPPSYLVERVELVFELEATHTRVSNTLQLKRNPDSDVPEPVLFLHGEALELLDIALDGRSLQPGEYQLVDAGLELPNPPERFQD